MKSLAFATVAQLQKLIQDKQITASEVLDYYLERFKKYDNTLNSAIQIFDKESIEADSQVHVGGALYGVPGLIKDNICQKNRLTTAGSNILAGFHATYDATVSERLKESGAFLLGRANCDEFAMGSSNETSAYGKAYNPWDLTRVPGGSSGGSAAAVAAGLVPWSLGSETGGSVRQPAAFCNLVGLKPTYGLVSRYGLLAYASSLDQVGVFTKTVKDSALILSSIAGHDERDSSTLSVDKKDYAQELAPTLSKKVTIGVIENALHAGGIDPIIVQKIEEAIKVLERSGATIKRIQLPVMDYAAAVYFILSRAEAASNLARYDGVCYGYRDKDAQTLQEMYERTRQKGFGWETKVRIMIGNYVLSAGHADQFYKHAKRVQRWMRLEFMKTFHNVDLSLSPVTPTPAFQFGAFDNDRLKMDLQDYFTCSANITGIPALAFPCGFSEDNLPIGVQLIGPHLSEQLLYNVANVYEQQTPWHTMHPQQFE